MCGLQESDGAVFINPARYIMYYYVDTSKGFQQQLLEI